MTLLILERVLSGGRKAWLVPALLLDVFCAAILAFLSLFFGLAGTLDALTWTELLAVFLGQGVGGPVPPLGAYFWVMHSAFLPTSFILLLILVWFLAKTALQLFSRLVLFSSLHRNPLEIAWTLFAAGLHS